jgi:hypothetical protein
MGLYCTDLYQVRIVLRISSDGKSVPRERQLRSANRALLPVPDCGTSIRQAVLKFIFFKMASNRCR